MDPFKRENVISKLNDYDLNIKEQCINSVKIVKDKTSKPNIDGYLYYKLEENKVLSVDLFDDKKLLMKLNHKEFEATYETIKFASGKVGIVGLGLGYTTNEIANKPNVDMVIVYEKSKEVIEMYKNNFGDNPKIKIINIDAFEAESDVFDFFFVDIYGYELSEKVVDDYIKFHQIHTIYDYTFFGVEHFLLSCSYEEIIWVYIPELWMSMCKDISGALESSGYIEYYKPLNEKVVSKVLMKFKEVLNEGME